MSKSQKQKVGRPVSIGGKRFAFHISPEQRSRVNGVLSRAKKLKLSWSKSWLIREALDDFIKAANKKFDAALKGELHAKKR